MGVGKVGFSKVPDVDDVTVEYECFRLDLIEVFQQFGRLTTISTQMKVTDDDDPGLVFF